MRRPSSPEALPAGPARAEARTLRQSVPPGRPIVVEEQIVLRQRGEMPVYALVRSRHGRWRIPGGRNRFMLPNLCPIPRHRCQFPGPPRLSPRCGIASSSTLTNLYLSLAAQRPEPGRATRHANSPGVRRATIHRNRGVFCSSYDPSLLASLRLWSRSTWHAGNGDEGLNVLSHRRRTSAAPCRYGIL